MQPCPLAVDVVHHGPTAAMCTIGKLITMADIVWADFYIERRIGRNTPFFDEWPPALIAPCPEVIF